MEIKRGGETRGPKGGRRKKEHQRGSVVKASEKLRTHLQLGDNDRGGQKD